MLCQMHFMSIVQYVTPKPLIFHYVLSISIEEKMLVTFFEPVAAKGITWYVHPVKNLRPNKNIPVFRVTQPCLNLPMKHIFSVCFEKIYNFMHFERQNAFQNA